MSSRLWLISTLVVVGAAVFVLVALVTAWPYLMIEILRREKTSLAWLSSALLVASGTVAVVLSLRAREHPAFAIMAFGLYVLAVDEWFGGHEAIKAFILKRVFDYDRSAMGKWGDLPLLLVPLTGGTVLWTLRREFRAGASRALLVGAFSVGLCAVAMDIAFLHPVAELIEELLELTAETLFLLALLAVAEGRLQRFEG